MIWSCKMNMKVAAIALFPFSRASIVSCIKSSTAQKDLSLGKSLHAHIIKFGFLPDILLSNHLLNMYCKLSSSLSDARKLFDEMLDRNLVSFSIMIPAYSRSGDPRFALRLVAELRWMALVPNQFIFSSSVVACSKLNALGLGKQVHTQVLVSGFEKDPFVRASLVDMYSKFGELGYAVSVFRCDPVRDPVIFNSMLSGFVASDCYREALELFRDARQCYGFKPTEFSFGSLINASGHLGRELGESLHGFIIKTGLEVNCFVGTSLVSMYGGYGDLESLEMVFDGVHLADLALYNAVFVEFSQNGLPEISLVYFRELMLKGYNPNECTFSSILKACGEMKSLSLGRILHGIVGKSKFRKDLVVNTALINMYMKCGMIEQSLTVFDLMHQRNTISYTSVITGLGQNGMANEAVSLFNEMNRNNLESDLATFISLIGSYSGHEWSVYVHAIKRGFGMELMIKNALLDCLFKSGASEEALQFFNKMKERDVVSWTTAISGLVQLDFHSKALELFKSMRSTTISPNRFTFSSALKACGSLASLQQGTCIHGCGIKHGLVNDEFTRSSLLDMYAKSGALDDSHRLFDEIPKRDTVSWNMMISAYAQHGYGHKALELYTTMELHDVEPDHSTFVSLLSACSHCGLVDDGIRIFKVMVSKHKIFPLSKHYACMVDMFGRAGMLARAKCFIEGMPFRADSSIWSVFLSACKLHGNVELAQLARDHVMEITGEDNPTLVLMSNMYSGAGKWDDSEIIRKRIGSGGLNKEPGVSWFRL